jgi:hypothetical protein
MSRSQTGIAILLLCALQGALIQTPAHAGDECFGEGPRHHRYGRA